MKKLLIVLCLFLCPLCYAKEPFLKFEIDAEKNANSHNNMGILYVQDKYYAAAIKEFQTAQPQQHGYIICSGQILCCGNKGISDRNTSLSRQTILGNLLHKPCKCLYENRLPRSRSGHSGKSNKALSHEFFILPGCCASL